MSHEEDETQEEQASFWATEMREAWLKEVSSASAMFMRIEDFLLEIEDLEQFAFNGHYVTKAKEMKSRLSTLQLRFKEASSQAQIVIDRALQDVDCLLIALTVYRKGLNNHHIGEVDEREASKAAKLHPVAISKRIKAQLRKEARERLQAERKLRTGRSLVARRTNQPPGDKG